MHTWIGEFIIANDNVTGSSLLLIQALTGKAASNHGKLLGRKWGVRGVVGDMLRRFAQWRGRERYVRVGWPPEPNVLSPDPHVIAQVEVSY
ncbi:MAG TPA: hypothetical protein VJT08_03045 [Terriglobales bacterium]|nr:hypothetical protein [Terriglobales bacterium]